MLVLARRVGERIILSGNGLHITLQVTSIDGGKVRLGITAPQEIIVMREELLEQDSKGGK